MLYLKVYKNNGEGFARWSIVRTDNTIIAGGTAATYEAAAKEGVKKLTMIETRPK